MSEPTSNNPTAGRSRWADWLGLNPSTLALLATILLVTAATELWSPLIPAYIKALREQATAGAAATILMVAAYGSYRDLLEAVNYYAGGAIGGWLNTRRSLLLFNLLPLLGLGVLAVWASPLAVFAAVPLVFVWDSIAGPSIITVVGSSVPAERRTMVFSLQAIFRRVARMGAYGVSAAAVWWLGSEAGFRAAAALGGVMLIGAMAMQYRYLRTAERDARVMIDRPREMLARFDPQLKRLLAADILARWAEGMPRELIILYCIPILSADRDAGAALYASVLLTIQAATNVASYLVVGPLASRAGMAKKPYIGLTFVFFALFPIALAGLGPIWGIAGLAAAFVAGGLRELGEPARKAMISELVEPSVKTQAVGLYWSVRSLAVAPAPIVGGLIWIGVEQLQPGWGPTAMLCTASVLGMAGALWFFARFGKEPG